MSLWKAIPNNVVYLNRIRPLITNKSNRRLQWKKLMYRLSRALRSPRPISWVPRMRSLKMCSPSWLRVLSMRETIYWRQWDRTYSNSSRPFSLGLPCSQISSRACKNLHLRPKRKLLNRLKVNHRPSSKRTNKSTLSGLNFCSFVSSTALPISDAKSSQELSVAPPNQRVSIRARSAAEGPCPQAITPTQQYTVVLMHLALRQQPLIKLTMTVNARCRRLPLMLVTVTSFQYRTLPTGTITPNKPTPTSPFKIKTLTIAISITFSIPTSSPLRSKSRLSNWSNRIRFQSISNRLLANRTMSVNSKLWLIRKIIMVDLLKFCIKDDHFAFCIRNGQFENERPLKG